MRKILFKAVLGVPIFDPKLTWFAPKLPKTFSILFQYVMWY
jgi:hypothetical protein